MAPGIHGIDNECKINEIYPLKYDESVEAMGYIKLTQTPEDIMKEGRKDVVGEILTIIGDGLWEMGD